MSSRLANCESPLPSSGSALPFSVLAGIGESLQEAFGVPFELCDCETGQILLKPDLRPTLEFPCRAELLASLGNSQEATLVLDEDPFFVLAIPISFESSAIVALAPFVARESDSRQALTKASRLFGWSSAQAQKWLAAQQPYPPVHLQRTAKLWLRNQELSGAQKKHRRELDELSTNFVRTYEEICLLHSVTQNLRISSDDESLGEHVLGWLSECLPVESVALQLLPVAREADVTYKARTQLELLQKGDLRLRNEQVALLVETLDMGTGSGPRVLNDADSEVRDWPLPEIRQCIVVPLSEGTRLLGWLLAVNHAAGLSLGTVEASLLNSVATMLAIHISNRDLYRQQAEFLASVVRAMTSAMDAKDPYTCGHSDRVARISVRLAQQLGCEAKLLHTLYMAGLLHDIGKIGINDAVLQKPGRLTAEEFEHIKQHPELGYRILADLKPLSDVLPAVLHHHEQWDGLGYPCQLAAEQIPLIARIVAVADAYDAMSSDRPYRKGMPLERVEEVFRAGAGAQWDPEVIQAYFDARDDIRQISSRERANLTLNVQQWI